MFCIKHKYLLNNIPYRSDEREEEKRMLICAVLAQNKLILSKEM